MKLISLCLFLLTHVQIYGQVNDSTDVSLEEVKEVLGFLASDSLKGRANATKELQQAAYFIEKEFSKDSLAFFDGLHSFLQPFILTQPKQKSPFKDSAGHFLTAEILYNVIGVLPGKTLPGEAILYSAHYDHVGSTSSGKDKIFNGANDDASGTTALFKLVSEPALSKDLFRRSDNYSFAKYGIPAHTIMTSDDSDPCYHKPCDEVSRIDFANMRNVIEAIIIGTRSLVDGTNRPHRIVGN